MKDFIIHNWGDLTERAYEELNAEERIRNFLAKDPYKQEQAYRRTIAKIAGLDISTLNREEFVHMIDTYDGRLIDYIPVERLNGDYAVAVICEDFIGDTTVECTVEVLPVDDFRPETEILEEEEDEEEIDDYEDTRSSLGLTNPDFCPGCMR